MPQLKLKPYGIPGKLSGRKANSALSKVAILIVCSSMHPIISILNDV